MHMLGKLYQQPHSPQNSCAFDQNHEKVILNGKRPIFRTCAPPKQEPKCEPNQLHNEKLPQDLPEIIMSLPVFLSQVPALQPSNKYME